MFVYFTRRLLYLIPMLLGISFLIYLGLELTPGDILSYLLPYLIRQSASLAGL